MLTPCPPTLLRISLDEQNTGAFDGDYVEFEAVVESPDSVREVSHTSFGSNFGKYSKAEGETAPRGVGH